MSISGDIAVGFILFTRRIGGLIIKPYETYRSLVERQNFWELIFIWTIIAGYFAFATLLKAPVFRVFLLTRQFMVLLTGALAGYILSVGVLWKAGNYFNGNGTFRGISIAWGYTLIPTVFWFLFTSFLYLLLPPPRTTSPAGITFSVVYLVVSTTIFFWKFISVYLTLRFGFQMQLKQIMSVLVIMIPVWALYAMSMYYFGIFKIPFI